MKSRRRREWFRRSSAMFMALALIISGLSLPEGLFSITAKAAEKASAEWTVLQCTKMAKMIIQIRN